MSIADLETLSDDADNASSKSEPHPCFIRTGYILFQRDALEYALEQVRGTLGRLRHEEVGIDLAKRVLFLGEESEFDSFMMPSNIPLEQGRNIRSIAMGYSAGHCGYTCPDRKGCQLTKLWARPNYTHEDPAAIKQVLYNFAQDLSIVLLDKKEKDAIIRWIEQNRYYRNEETHGNIGLEQARIDFESRFNKFFLHMGFQLGMSEEYGACNRERFLTDTWYEEVHGAHTSSDREL